MKMNRLARAKDLMTKVVNLAVEKLTNWTYKTTGAYNSSVNFINDEKC